MPFIKLYVLGTHSYEKCAEKIIGIQDNFDLTSTKVTRVITDNGSNFVKAFQIFGLKTMTIDGELIELDEDEEEDDQDDVEFVDIPEENQDGELLYELPRREKCFSHTLSLICTTDLEKVKYGSNWRIAGKSGTAMAKIKGLWNKTNYPKSAEVIFKWFGKNIGTPNATRWNALFDCLTEVLHFGLEVINGCIEELGLSTLTSQEHEYLKEHCKCLAPIAIGIDKCQAEQTCFYGMGIPIIRKIKKDFLELQRADLKYCRPLVDKALVALEERFGNFLTQDKSVMDALIATVSHPRFKMKWILEEKQESLQSQIITIAEQLMDSDSSANENQEEKDPYFDLSDDEEPPENSQNRKNRVSIEVLQYLADTDTNLQMLHRYPAMKEIFLKYNTALISSAPVERLFSFGSIILQGRRGRLTDTNFEKLMLMKAMANTK